MISNRREQKKNKKEISKQKPKIDFSNWNTSDADEIERRKARAELEKFNIQNLEPSQTYYSDFKEKILFGIQSINRQGVDIQLTNLARTFVDVLDRIELCGGWEEVSRAVSNMHALNIDEVIEYCLMLENARLAAKEGYFLEKRQGVFSVAEKQIKKLLDAKPISPQYVSKRGHEKFQLIKEWNLFMPISVINQSWEEPHVK